MRTRMKAPTKPAPSRMTRTHLTITAASATERPSAWIERLKGGELSWGVRTPAASTRAAVDKVMQEAARLRAQVKVWDSEREEAMWQKAEARFQKKEVDNGQ